MKKTPLEQVDRVRQARQEAAGRQLAEAEQHLAEQCRRAEELLGYLHDYEHAPAATNAMLLANRATFIGRLRMAVEAQSQQIRQAEQAVEASRTRYLLARQDRRVLEQLNDSYRRAADFEAQRKEQHALDDWAGARRVGALV